MNHEENPNWALLPDEALIHLFLTLDVEGKLLDRNEIAWREVYLIRDMYEKMTDALFDFVEVNGEGIIPQPKEDYFALGWISVEGAIALRDKINTELYQIQTLSDQSIDPLVTISEFILRFELRMAENTGAYCATEVKMLETFIEKQENLILMYSPNEPLLLRIAAYTQQIIKQLMSASVPISVVSKLLRSTSTITANPVTEDLVRTNFETFLYCVQMGHSSVNPNDWMTTDQTPAPEIVFDFNHYFRNYLGNKSYNQKMALNLLKDALRKIDTTTHAGKWTAIAACSGIHYDRRSSENLDYIMTEFVLPYFQFTDDPSVAVAMLWYYSRPFYFIQAISVSSRISLEVSQKIRYYVSRIIEVVLALLETSNSIVRFWCCDFLCTLETNLLAPHSEALIDKIAPILTDANPNTQLYAGELMSKLVEPEIYSKKKEVIHDCLWKLEALNNEPSEMTSARKCHPQTSILIIGSKIKDDYLVSKIYSIFKSRLEKYLQTKDEESADALIAMTPKFISALPKELIEKHFQDLYSIIMHYANIPIDDDDSDCRRDNVIELKKCALKSISKVLITFDRNYLSSYFEGFKQVLSHNFETIYGVLQMPATKAFSKLVKKFFTVDMEASWRMQIPTLLAETFTLFKTALQSNSFWNIQTKVLRHFNSIVIHLTHVSPTHLLSIEESLVVICEAISSLMGTFHARNEIPDGHTPNEIEDDEQTDFGEEVVKLFDFVLENAPIQEELTDALVLLFEQILENIEKYGTSDIQWLDLRIIIAVYNHFGEELMNSDPLMSELLYYMHECKDSESEYLQECLKAITRRD